jgi:hypothetical protein
MLLFNGPQAALSIPMGYKHERGIRPFVMYKILTNL